MKDFVGQQIDRYYIIERLGVGGMAVVYKAFDTRLERDVAIKLIRTEAIPQEQHERLFKRFEREAKAQARFKHNHIVKVFDYGEKDGYPYLVMDYVPGGTLKARIGQPIPFQQAAEWLIPIADALNYAHKRGVIHRDIKPSNILFDEENQPVLTDFGIAKMLETDEAALTITGTGVGTPEYMAPEQWLGIASPATDQYALAVVLYELITGQKPYTADTPPALAIVQATEPLRRPSLFVPEIPNDVEKIIFKAMARNPEDRYANMSDFQKALGYAAEGELQPEVIGESTKTDEGDVEFHEVPPEPAVVSDHEDENETVDIINIAPDEDDRVEKESLRGKAKPVKKKASNFLKWVGMVTAIGVLLGLFFVFRPLFVNSDKPSEISETPTKVSSIENVTLGNNPSQIEIAEKNEKPTTPTVLLFEDFEDVKNVELDWDTEVSKITSEETGNFILDMDNMLGGNFPGFDFGQENWGDYEITFDFRFLEAKSKWIILYFRKRDNTGNSYVVHMGTDGVGLDSSTNWSDWHPIAFKELNFINNQWYSFKLSVKGQEIKVFIDERLVIYENNPLWGYGKFTLQVGPQSHSQFDNFQILSLNDY